MFITYELFICAFYNASVSWCVLFQISMSVGQILVMTMLCALTQNAPSLVHVTLAMLEMASSVKVQLSHFKFTMIILILFLVIQFEESSYEVPEDVGADSLALRVCVNTSQLATDRVVRVLTISGTAIGEA